MHSMHHPIQAQQMQQFQEQQSQQQTQATNNQQEAQQQQQQQQQDQQATMTVLETLEPVQAPQQQQQQQPPAILSSLEQVQPPSVATTNSSSPPGTAASVIHHQLVQAQPPHLHQLQAPSNRCNNLLEVNEQLLHQQQQQDNHQMHQQQQQFRPANDKLARQRPHIEGIVADGGGPIVQWLLDNYEIADGESLPRSTVYNHYLAHCRQLQMSPVNAASFGKLIRSVFVGLKTRRLGTRGHSKYHYFGVRAKQHVRHEWSLQERDMDLGGPAGSSRDVNENSNQNTDNGSESDSTGGRLSSSGMGGGGPGGGGGGSSSSSKRMKTSNHSYQSPTDDNNHFVEHHLENPTNPAGLNQANGFYYSNGVLNGYEMNNHHDHHHEQHFNHHHHHHQAHKHNGTTTGADCFVWPLDHCDLSILRNHLGPNWATLVDDNWPQRQQPTGRNDDLLDNNLVEVFEENYKNYYRRMVELLSELKFGQVEQLCFEFWHPSAANADHSATKSTIHWTINNNNNTGTENNENHSTEATPADQMSQEHLHSQQQQNGHHLQHHNYQQQQQQQQVATLATPNNLTFSQLYQLTSQPKMIERVNQIDYCLYAAIESFLLPDLISQIPHPLNHNIRLFAELIGNWIELAIKDYAAQFVAEKSRSARAFGHALRRYASINHLSAVSRAIWDKRPILDQMSMDLGGIDLRDIEQQVLLMNQAECVAQKTIGEEENRADGLTATSGDLKTGNIQQENNENNNNSADQQASSCAIQPAQLVTNFLHLLKDPYPANSWPEWCRNLVESSCVFGNGQPSTMVRQDARNFILKWNFYINLIMKELTLKSAPSLASFQLIRLLFDEYMYYLVVSKLARSENKTLAQLLTPTSGVL